MNLTIVAFFCYFVAIQAVCPPSSDTCIDGCKNSEIVDCENCVYVCTCTPDEPEICPDAAGNANGFCGIIDPADDGCGELTPQLDCVGSCPSGQVCGVEDLCCPTTCTTTVNDSRGVPITLNGICADTQPDNTIPGGPCTAGRNCGTCYVSSFDTQLCSAGVNGKPCAGGKCGCFVTINGASCKSDNFLAPYPVPLPSNGGGCQENLCNAVAAKNGRKAACCPSGCTK